METNRFLKPCEECNGSTMTEDGYPCYKCYGSGGYFPSELGEELLEFLGKLDFRPRMYDNDE